MTMKQAARKLGYLAAAPRVSTRPDAGLYGPRAHVLGVMRAFEILSWDVKPFIVGDRMPRNWSSKRAEDVIIGGGIKTLAADFMRVGMGVVNARRAWQELGSQVDWVYERGAAMQALGWIFKRRGGIPWILEINAPLFYESKNVRKTLVLSSLAQYIELKAYRECDVLVCVGETLRNLLIHKWNIPDEKIWVMPNGVDIAFFNPEQYQLYREFDGLTIGFVGQLIAWQGLELLIDAIHELKTEGLILPLVVVGDGNMRKAWEAKVHSLDLANNVKFTGHVSRDQVPHYIRGFDVGYSGQIPIQMGTMYNSPLKIYEYMAMAKPVIASNFEDACRVISNDETGFLFQAGDKESLKRTLRKVYQYRAKLSEMGRKGREEIINNHSWTVRVSALIDGVENILGQKQ